MPSKGEAGPVRDSTEGEQERCDAALMKRRDSSPIENEFLTAVSSVKQDLQLLGSGRATTTGESVKQDTCEQ